jgi:hypothetical protein
MRLSPVISAAVLILLVGCAVRSPFEPDLDLSFMPPEMPRTAIADLDPNVQDQMQRGLTTIERRLSPVCTPTQVAQAKEALVLFGWSTSARLADPRMQAYVDRRGPELRAARQNLAPACEAQVAALVQIVRETNR